MARMKIITEWQYLVVNPGFRAGILQRDDKLAIMALHLYKITDANSIMAAREAKLCILQLEYEYDPCSDSPEKLIWNLEKEEVRMFRHQETSVDLLALDQKILLTGDFEGLVDPVQTYWKCRAPLLSFPETSIAGRLHWALQTNCGKLKPHCRKSPSWHSQPPSSALAHL